MKNKPLKLLILLTVLAFAAIPKLKAQQYMSIWLKDGTVMEFAIGGIDKLTFDGSSHTLEYADIMKQLLEMKVYPNPTADFLNIDYKLAESGDVIIEIFDSSGRRFFTLNRGFQYAGIYEYQWLAAEAPPGIYICLIRQNKSIVSEKIIVK
jgi:ribosomal silencing factor RsfS